MPGSGRDYARPEGRVRHDPRSALSWTRVSGGRQKPWGLGNPDPDRPSASVSGNPEPTQQTHTMPELNSLNPLTTDDPG